MGRLWYIDEMTDMKKVTGETGSTYFTDATGAMMIPESFNGVLSWAMTPMEMARMTATPSSSSGRFRDPAAGYVPDGTMPRITYHFSDVAFAGRLEDGTPCL